MLNESAVGGAKKQIPINTAQKNLPQRIVQNYCIHTHLIFLNLINSTCFLEFLYILLLLKIILAWSTQLSAGACYCSFQEENTV